MAEEKTVEKTKVEKVDVNLDEIFGGAPGAESVTVPDDETKKPNMFSRKEDVDMSFVETKTEEPKEEEEVKEEEETAETKTETKT